MFLKKQDKSADDFWREYEEQTGEKVLARTLGQYISGWKEFDETGMPLWGLAIVTSGGFRFHHFPQQNWLDALIRPPPVSGTPKEKTLFIPGGCIISAALQSETRWWKKLLNPGLPLLKIRYRCGEEPEKELLIQTEYNTEGLIENLHAPRAGQA
jgi:hypothetical protein